LKLDHPPYSLHLAHATFGYPQNWTLLFRATFSDIAEIQGHAMTILKSIPEEEFQKCFD
jgi:hypothetical protein